MRFTAKTQAQTISSRQTIRMLLSRSPFLPATRAPEQETPVRSESELNISVVFTTVEATLTALRSAGTLAKQLGGRITLVVPEVVPYHLPLNKPPVVHAWNEDRFRALAAASPVETSVKFYLCRDADETLVRELTPRSLVVIGVRKHWWPTREARLAANLRRAGHEVILAEME